MSDVTEEKAIGWDAIDAQLQKVYGDQKPKHYGSLISYRLGGDHPLDGVSVYENDEPIPHWHYVSYGLTELYEKESENKELSGYGFELTFRLKKETGETEPPMWVISLLQNLARYVMSTGNVFRNGDYMNANGPICEGADTELKALSFTEDEQLQTISTAHGEVMFLQVIGITEDELEAMQCWNTSGVWQTAQEMNLLPNGMTDLSRASLLQNEAFNRRITEGAEREGSSTGFLYVDQLDFTLSKKLFRSASYTLTIGAQQTKMLGLILKGRLLKGESLTLAAKGFVIVFTLSHVFEVKPTEAGYILMLTEENIEELVGLWKPKAGTYPLQSAKGMSMLIAPTHLRDSSGNVVEVIG
ncbi:BtrU protein [Fictibacillus macauensis ZFHKF-1]|uniref:BtrU protein n=1 Tax=Fictibacillus macauensis ZFHKF-1 TaxID=1196324 RepID=I8UHD4_9BACL|nr:suppressor of fused domain protein [Fictibacillus macauensis]EIT86238.1 BtrU protein [Fictibacillus macauensis ZFHKF-1]